MEEADQVISNGLPSNTIQFSLPAGPQTIMLTGASSITQNLTITGPGANLLTVSGNNLDRVFIVGVIFTQNLGLNVTMKVV